MERTLVLIKPDAIQRGLAGAIIGRLERRGLKIVAMKMLQMDKSLAQKHYAIHQGKGFFEDLVNYISSCPVIAAVFEGNNAVQVVRNAMGETNPVNASPGTIRGDLALEIGRNLVHGSDSVEAAQEETQLFFSATEVFHYSREVDKWVIG